MTTLHLPCRVVHARLDDYLARVLDDGAVAELELHVAGCAACAALVRDLEALTRGARALPDVEPSRDLWTGIAARLAAPATPRTPVVRPAPSRRRVRAMLGRGAALAAGVAGLAWLAGGDGPTAAPGTPAPAAAIATREGAAGAGGPVVVAREAAPTLDTEVAALRDVLAHRRDDLEPATIAVLERSLAVTDSAIAEARRALAADPSSSFLSSTLSSALARKLGLLRTVALLPART